MSDAATTSFWGLPRRPPYRSALVREQNTCRCDRLVPVGIDLGLVDEQRPAFASHAGVVLPIETDPLAAAAAELDLAVACGLLHRMGPH